MVLETRIGSVTVRVVEGDICDRRVDAVVNAANNELWMGGGVAGALKRRGGEGIEREAMSKGPIEVGDAVVTGAGDLPARYVIHAAAMGSDLVTDAEKIRKATLSALALARELGLQSIAFPALGTGVGGFSPEGCATIMREALVDHAATETSLDTVEFVLYGREAFEAFARTYQAK